MVEGGERVEGGGGTAWEMSKRARGRGRGWCAVESTRAREWMRERGHRDGWGGDRLEE